MEKLVSDSAIMDVTVKRFTGGQLFAQGEQSTEGRTSRVPVFLRWKEGEAATRQGREGEEGRKPEHVMVQGQWRVFLKAGEKNNVNDTEYLGYPLFKRYSIG